MNNSYELTYENVWKTLSRVECVNTDKKGNFTYMSWAVAWIELMKYYPSAQYEFLPESKEDNGTVMVNCIVKIGHLERSMWLPIMDYNNNSIKNPTTRQISDARMRCLVKAIAMFGLGHHIFSMKNSSFYGEDLPDAKKDKSEKAVVENTYNLVSIDGEDLGLWIGEDDLFKELKAQLGVKKSQVNTNLLKFFDINRDTIESAIANSGDKRFENIITFYESIDREGVSDETET